MQDRLRPTAEIAPEAILVGDPGRALLLAQELLDQPKMSNHSRGLWGYSGTTPAGRPLTIQATGIGGPSAAVVLGELAGLGVGRAVRVGSCLGDAGIAPGSLFLVEAALAAGGSASAFGVAPGATIAADAALSARLAAELEGRAETGIVASFDSPPPAGGALPEGARAADLQTLALFARGRGLGIDVAALLVVVEADGNPPISDESRDLAAKLAGAAAAAVLSP